MLSGFYDNQPDARPRLSGLRCMQCRQRRRVLALDSAAAQCQHFGYKRPPSAPGEKLPALSSTESAVGAAIPIVVLADDDPAWLTIWERVLEGTCTIVAKAADGPSALAAIRRFKPDVAVLDISMPELTGIDVARTAIEEQPKLGSVLCSVMRDAAISKASVDIGARGYVLKPNVVHDLANAVAAVAAGGRFLHGAG